MCKDQQPAPQLRGEMQSLEKEDGGGGRRGFANARKQGRLVPVSVAMPHISIYFCFLIFFSSSFPIFVMTQAPGMDGWE